MTDWYSRAREEDGRTDDEILAEIRAVPKFIDLICPVCRRTTYAPLGTYCQWDKIDLVPPDILVSTGTGPQAMETRASNLELPLQGSDRSSG